VDVLVDDHERHQHLLLCTYNTFYTSRAPALVRRRQGVSTRTALSNEEPGFRSALPSADRLHLT
jgi:hypothetical protein